MRGGWYFGIPTSAHLKRTLHTAVQRGYAFASIACTSSRYQKFPYQIWEVKTAIRYLRANAETYRLDPTGLHFGVSLPAPDIAIPYLKQKLPATGSWIPSTSGLPLLQSVKKTVYMPKRPQDFVLGPFFFTALFTHMRLYFFQHVKLSLK